MLLRLNVFFILFFTVSCAQFGLNRSFLAEMEYDDTPYFDGGRDFPVMGGDSGKPWRNRKDLGRRTPASEYDVERRHETDSLKKELHALEDAQSEHHRELYTEYGDKLGTSEKIYFLRLPMNERTEYLQARGLIQARPESSISPLERMRAQRQSQVLMGMSKEDVRRSWGTPEKVEIAGNPNYENERWAYNYNGATKYIYFESGRVGGWE